MLGVRNVFTALGDAIRTGGRLRSCAPAASPCRAAFELSADRSGTRPSWDPIAVLFAARGEAHASVRAYALGGGGATNCVDAAGANFWPDRVAPLAAGVGVAGGRCVCPNGGSYWAGIEGDAGKAKL